MELLFDSMELTLPLYYSRSYKTVLRNWKNVKVYATKSISKYNLQTNCNSDIGNVFCVRICPLL
jgi:hypothetical protein